MKMKIRLAALLLLLSGCASRQFTVTLFRTGGAPPVTERYSVNQDGVGTKLVKIPLDSESKQWTYQVDPKLFAEIRGLMTDSLNAISKIEMLDTGELTSGITVDAEKTHNEITWANIDPPNVDARSSRAMPAFDSLYGIMLRVESRMVSP